METKTFTATVSADVAERIEDYARSTDQTVSTVIELAIESWAAWEKEKDRLTVEALENGEKSGFVDDEAVGAWIDSLATDKPLPRPRARK